MSNTTTTTQTALQKQGGAAERSTKIKIDWVLVHDLCSIGCTQKEVCAVLKISHDTLTRRCKEEYDQTFAEYHMEYVDSTFKVSLRRAMHRAAITNGNPPLLIFLAKNYLGMSDKIEHSAQASGDVAWSFMEAPERIENADTSLELKEGENDHEPTTDAHHSLLAE